MRFAKRLSDVCESTQHVCELTVCETTRWRNDRFPSKQPTVRFIGCRNLLDRCLSVEFTESGNMAVRSNSAVSENLRIREFKESVSARPHLRKRSEHKCFPQRLLKFPLAETWVSVKKPLYKGTKNLLISPCESLYRVKLISEVSSSEMHGVLRN